MRLFFLYLIDYSCDPGTRAATSLGAPALPCEGRLPVITVEESVHNQKARLAEIAQKLHRRRTLQFSAHGSRIKFRFASPKGQRLTEWSREYRAREIAEKSDLEVVHILRAF
jgi:hypothetical protein